MSPVLSFLLLGVAATLAGLPLERARGGGYGWVSGSEFALAGLALGPFGLDALSLEMLDQARPLLLLAAAWHGLRFGLRIGPAGVVAPRALAAALVEAVGTVLALRLGLEGVRRAELITLAPLDCWLLATLGAATTKSSLAWARSRLAARGPVTDSLEGIARLDDLVLLVGVSAVLAFDPLVGSALPPGTWAPTLATLGLGPALGLLVLLLIGRGAFRPDMAWIGLFGATALGGALAQQLGLCGPAVTALAGFVVGRASPHAAALEAMGRATEAPAMRVLLVLAGAALPVDPTLLGAAVLLALLRMAAKLLASAPLAGWGSPGRATAGLGFGLLGSGGLAFATALVEAPEVRAGPLLIAFAVANVVAGDLIGAPALRWLLGRFGELGQAEEPSGAGESAGAITVEATP